MSLNVLTLQLEEEAKPFRCRSPWTARSELLEQAVDDAYFRTRDSGEIALAFTVVRNPALQGRAALLGGT